MMKSFPLEMENGHNDRIDVRVGGRKERVGWAMRSTRKNIYQWDFAVNVHALLLD